MDLAEHLVTNTARGDFHLLLSHVTDDVLFVGTDANVIYGAENLRDTLSAQPQNGAGRPAYLVRDAHFSVLSCASPLETVVVGQYLVYSDLTTRALSSELQRVMLCMRWCRDMWRAYHVHLSNAWQPISESHRFPINVSEQTYRYVQAILRAARKLGGGTGERLALATQHSVLYVDPSLVLYVEADDKHCILHTATGQTKVHRLLGEVEKLLPAEFVRISRKHVVNRTYLLGVGTRTITLVDGTELPVPKRRMPEVKQALRRTSPDEGGAMETC